MSKGQGFIELLLNVFFLLMGYTLFSGVFYRFGEYFAEYIIVPALYWTGLL